MKDKVVFETNVPVEVCLTHLEGKEIGGRQEEPVMYDRAAVLALKINGDARKQSPSNVQT